MDRQQISIEIGSPAVAVLEFFSASGVEIPTPPDLVAVLIESSNTDVVDVSRPTILPGVPETQAKLVVKSLGVAVLTARLGLGPPVAAGTPLVDAGSIEVTVVPRAFGYAKLSVRVPTP